MKSTFVTPSKKQIYLNLTVEMEESTRALREFLRDRDWEFLQKVSVILVFKTAQDIRNAKTFLETVHRERDHSKEWQPAKQRFNSTVGGSTEGYYRVLKIGGRGETSTMIATAFDYFMYDQEFMKLVWLITSHEDFIKVPLRVKQLADNFLQYIGKAEMDISILPYRMHQQSELRTYAYNQVVKCRSLMVEFLRAFVDHCSEHKPREALQEPARLYEVVIPAEPSDLFVKGIKRNINSKKKRALIALALSGTEDVSPLAFMKLIQGSKADPGLASHDFNQKMKSLEDFLPGVRNKGLSPSHRKIIGLKFTISATKEALLKELEP